MTKRIEEVLDLPPLEELLDGETNPESEEALNKIVLALEQNDQEVDRLLSDPDGVREHAREMDEIHDAAMTAHKDAIDLAFNMEPKNAGSIMEPAARFLEIAMKASQNKQEARMKSIKQKMEQERHNRDMKKDQEEGVVDGETPIAGQLADRNALLKTLRNQNNS